MGLISVSLMVIAICGVGAGAFDLTSLILLEALLDILACVMLTLTLPKVFRRFEKYNPFSLSLYLLNGYFLVISRTLSNKVLGISDPLLIILINVLIDFYVSYLLIRHLLSRIPFLRIAIGLS